jgi:hypothetical protein
MVRGVFAYCLLAVPGFVAAFTSVSRAQPVSVGLADGVHVRAPFVSVDVFPGGGVHVRAPFAAVDVGGRPYYEGPPVASRIIREPAYPSPQAIAAMDDATLRRKLQDISLRLHNRLGRFDTGATWQQYLRLPNELVADSTVDAATQQAAAAMLLNRFRNVAAEPRYQKIAVLPAFTAMQTALTELDARYASGVPGPIPTEELPPPQQPTNQNERSVIVPM